MTRWNTARWKKALISHRFILGLLSLNIVLIRLLTFDEPFEKDLMMYAVAARELLAGRPLYSDIWDIKPPGVYIIYAFSQALVGYNGFSIFLLGVCSAIATLIGVFQVVRFFTGNSLSALWSAFFWSLVCSDIMLQANQPNVEVFLNIFFVWALFYFVKAFPHLRKDIDSFLDVTESKKLCYLLTSGILFALSSIFKQVSLTVPLLLSIYVFCSPLTKFCFRSVIIKTTVFLIPILLIWSGLSAYFYATDRWNIFYFTMVSYGKMYTASGFELTSQMSIWDKLFPASVYFLLPLILLSVAATLILRRNLPQIWFVLWSCAFAIQASIVLPGNYFPHYYQLWLPLVCISAGIAIAEWKRIAKNRKLIVQATFFVGFVTLLGQWKNWNLTPDQVSIEKYGSSFFVDLREKAKKIDTLLLSDETFYQYGFDPGFYFESGRRAPIGIINIGTPFVPQTQFLQDKIIADLNRKKPEMAIVDRFFPPSRVTRYLYQNYVPVPHFQQSGNFMVLARCGGNLLRRSESFSGYSTYSHSSLWELK